MGARGGCGGPSRWCWLALTALALAGFDVWGGWFTPAQMRPAVWVGQAFLATCLYLFLGLVPVWLVCVGIWLARGGPTTVAPAAGA